LVGTSRKIKGREICKYKKEEKRNNNRRVVPRLTRRVPRIYALLQRTELHTRS